MSTPKIISKQETCPLTEGYHFARTNGHTVVTCDSSNHCRAGRGGMVEMVIVVGVLLAMVFVPLFGLIIFRP